jgi:hypothetical protein
MARRLAWAGIVAAALAATVAAVSGAATRAASCSTNGLSVAPVRVVLLRAEGVSCTSARKVAGSVARDVAYGRTISIAGSIGFGMTEQSCTGCRTTTRVSVTYPHGSITVGLSGGSGPSEAPPEPIPTPEGVPGTVI